MRKLLVVSICAGILLLALAACAQPESAAPRPTTGSPLPPATVVSPATPTPMQPPITPGSLPVSPAVSPGNTAAAPAGVQAAQAAVAQQLGVPAAQVAMQRYEEVEWPNSCLGANNPQEMCLQVITPGYLIIFQTPRGNYEAHTDRSGTNLRLVQPPAGGGATAGTVPAKETAAITWERTGGIAGICQRLTIYASGRYLLENCKNNSVTKQGTLDRQDLAQFSDLLGRYGAFEWRSTPPPGSADMFADHYTVFGRSTQVPPDADRAGINDQLAGLVTRLLAAG